jgi:hypothetical protein
LPVCFLCAAHAYRFGGRYARKKEVMETMKILKCFADEEVWNEITQDECLDKTEGSGYWKPGSVLSMLEGGHVIHTPFARYKAAEQNMHPTGGTPCEICGRVDDNHLLDVRHPAASG